MLLSFLSIYSRLFKEVFETFKERLLGGTISLEVLAFFKFQDKCFFLLGKGLWYKYGDVDDDVTLSVAITLYGRKSFSSEAHLLAWLGSWFNLEGSLTINSWYFYLSAKSCSSEIKNKIVIQVLTVTLKDVALFFLDKNLDVTIDAIMLASISFAAIR